MSDHTHRQFVEGCYRCDLSRDEILRDAEGEVSDLDELERLAKAQASGYARMLELDGGIGKLGVEHPEMHDDMLAWQEATEDEHADTVLSLVARVREAESVIEEALEAFRKPYENTTQPNSRMTAVLGILSTYEKGAAQ